jgi:hypothetical protein
LKCDGGGGGLEPWIKNAFTINSAVFQLYLELDLHIMNCDVQDISTFLFDHLNIIEFHIGFVLNAKIQGLYFN